MKRVERPYKIIVDSNIWISFLIGKSLKGFQYFLDSQAIEIITCQEQLTELWEVFKRPKIRKYINKNEVDEFFDLLDFVSVKIRISTQINLCRDAKDNFLLSLVVDSNADFLITGDMDLLELKSIGNAKIIKYNEFEKYFEL
jgi:uncharacterized protein